MPQMLSNEVRTLKGMLTTLPRIWCEASVTNSISGCFMEVHQSGALVRRGCD